jgi:cytochrome P450
MADTLPITQQPTIAPGPKQNPISMFFSAQVGVLQYLLNLQRQYGDVVRLPGFGVPAHLITHPDGVKHVLQDHNRNYPKSETYQQMKMILGNGLVTSEGDFWLKQRRLAQPAFHRQRIAAFAETMTEATARMLDRWQPNTTINLSNEMMALTMQIIAKTMFSADLSTQSDSIGQHVGEAFRAYDKLSGARIKLPAFLPTPQRRRFQKAKAAIDQVVYSLIEQHRQSNQDHGDLLSMLMLSKDEETGQGMTDQQLRDEVLTIFLAGHETTSNALSWTFYLLSKHPEVARRLRAEINDVLGGRTPGIHDLPHLKYTLMVIEESMRILPPVWSIERRALADDTIGGYHIPAGSVIYLSQYVTHRHPEFWPNPEGFDPERFSPEQVAARPRSAYFPFAAGPRQCIGNSFALMEAQLILAMVVQRYQLDLVPGHPVETEPLITLNARHGILAAVRPAAG